MSTLPRHARRSSGGDRAQSGIGTLIILIAALLIAAATAGVFFETAGLFRGETESTSEDVSNQLSGRLDVLAVSGQVYDGRVIEVVNITVKPSGDRAVDLRRATLQWVGPSGAADIVWAGSNASGPTFGITMESTADGALGVLTAESDRTRIEVAPGDGINATTRIDGERVDIADTGPALEPGERVLVDILTESRTTYRLRVPEILRDNETVGL
jgi:flagellin-like protein